MEKIANWIQCRDITTFFFLNRSFKNPTIDWLMSSITNLGGAVWSIALTIVFLLNRNFLGEQVGVRLGTSLLLSHLVVQICKRLLPRQRPYQTLQNVLTGSKHYKDPSFPSGHSTASFCTATVFAGVLPEFSVIFFCFASLVAVSRVYLGMHYPSDVTIGAVLGVVTALWIS